MDGQRYRVLFTASRILLGVAYGLLIFRVPWPLAVLMLLVGGIWFVGQAASMIITSHRMRNRTCHVCGRRSGSMFPVKVAYARLRWWRPQFMIPLQMEWVCLDHVETYVRLEAHTRRPGPSGSHSGP